MDSSATPLPPIDATVLLVDASPLIHLAMIDALDLPLRFGPVVVPDAVEIETTHDRSKPFAAEIRSWMDRNVRRVGSNTWVERPRTDVGSLLELAIEMGRPRPRNVGEHAIVNWLADNVAGFGGPALVIYENGKVPNMLVREGLPDDVIVVTTRAFLTLAKEAGFLPHPDEAWDKIAAADARANPALAYQIIKGRAR